MQRQSAGERSDSILINCRINAVKYSSNFHQVLNAFVSQRFFKRHVHLPPDRCPREIAGNSKFFPYFEDVRSTVDGSLFAGFFSADAHARYRCRKGAVRTLSNLCMNL